MLHVRAMALARARAEMPPAIFWHSTRTGQLIGADPERRYSTAFPCDETIDAMAYVEQGHAKGKVVVAMPLPCT